MKLLPIHNHAGTVTAEVLVDDEDYAWASQHRWSLSPNGYVGRVIYLEGGRADRRTDRLTLHREILGLSKGDGRMGDHIHGDKLDCRRSQLRIVTPKGNAQNRRSRPGSSSRFRGVSWDAKAGKWRADVRLDGRCHFLGHFSDEAEAAACAANFRREHMPDSLEAIGARP